MNFFSSSSTKEVSVIFTIQPESISGALVLYEKGRVPHILYSFKAPHKLFPHSYTLTFKPNMDAWLNEVAHHLKKEGAVHLRAENLTSRHITSTYCIISPPWLESRVKKNRLTNKDGYKVTQHLLRDALDQDAEIFKSSVEKNQFSSTSQKPSFEIIEKTLLEVRLNGYITDSPIGKKVKDVELTSLISVTESDIISAVERASSAISKNDVLFFSSTKLLSTATSVFYPDKATFSHLRIGMYESEFIITVNNTVHKKIMLPCGITTLIQHIVRELAVPEDMASTYLKLFFLKNTEEEFTKRMKKVVDSVAEEYKVFFSDIVTVLKQSPKPIQDVFIVTENEFSEFFSTTIRQLFEEKKLLYTPDLVNFNVKNIMSWVSIDPISKPNTELVLSTFIHKRRV